MTVYAFSPETNFYPITWEKLGMTMYDVNDEILYDGIVDINTSNNTFKYTNGNISNIDIITFYLPDPDYTKNFAFPYNPDLYDYYLLGTMTGYTMTSSLSTWVPTDIYAIGWDNNTNSGYAYPRYDINVYNLDSYGKRGFGFSERIDFSSFNNIGIQSIYMYGDKDGVGNKPANISVEFGILALDKSSSESSVSAAILSKLNTMEDNLISSLEEQTGILQSAINDQYTMSESEDFGVGQIVDQVEEKLGVLTFGADTLNNFLGLFQASNVGGTELTFPGFKIDVQGVSYNAWPDITFDLAFLEENFGILITAVRTVTVLCVWLAVLGYLVKAKDHFINNKG